MKKFACLFSVIFGIFFAQSVYAAPTLTTNQNQDVQVMVKDYEVMVIDFTINVDEPDILKALTATVNGGGVFYRDYFNVRLWIDRGLEGYQGYGYDQLVTQSPSNAAPFIFDGLDINIIESTRFFVTIDIGTSGFPPNTLEFVIQQPNDFNADGEYEEGEQGVFLESGLIDSYFGGSTRRVIFSPVKADVHGPRSFVNDVSNIEGQPTLFAVDNGQITFTGMAKDRNGGVVDRVELLIGDLEPVQAEIARDNETEWTAVYNVPSDLFETYTMYINAVDGLQKPALSGPYYLTIDSRTINASNSLLSLSKTSAIANGSDKITFTVNVKDGASNPLDQRTVHFRFYLNGDDFVSASKVTNASGVAVLDETFGLPGNYRVDVTVDDVLLDTASFTVAPNPDQPEPDTNFDNINAGDLIKGSQDAVYYYSSLGKRHVFVTQSVYASWYGDNFDSVKTITDEQLASIELGLNVPYKPGTMLTAPSVNEVYVVTRGISLRHIPSETFAKTWFGDNWNKMIFDMQESLLFAYDISDPFAENDNPGLSQFDNASVTIDAELMLSGNLGE